MLKKANFLRFFPLVSWLIPSLIGFTQKRLCSVRLLAVLASGTARSGKQHRDGVPYDIPIMLLHRHDATKSYYLC